MHLCIVLYCIYWAHTQKSHSNYFHSKSGMFFFLLRNEKKNTKSDLLSMPERLLRLAFRNSDISKLIETRIKSKCLFIFSSRGRFLNEKNFYGFGRVFFP